jgi:hypothetical protein
MAAVTTVVTTVIAMDTIIRVRHRRAVGTVGRATVITVRRVAGRAVTRAVTISDRRVVGKVVIISRRRVAGTVVVVRRRRVAGRPAIARRVRRVRRARLRVETPIAAITITATDAAVMPHTI